MVDQDWGSQLVTGCTSVVTSVDRVPSSPDPIRLQDKGRGVEVVAPLPKISFVKVDHFRNLPGSRTILRGGSVVSTVAGPTQKPE